ncbi:MAG: indolepyruvate ferredoxin oxidoreductase subunit alpha [Clostridiales bacterium]|jgi:indolepyruvate ferredoxin oxidoreductase alpha subunit|nr:indolepyruvate ferredoxin oxidoreductase subunit alpha [Clostridiales bacterium]
MKELMLGNHAVARGLYEAGVKVVSSYPGTPSTEITEYVAECYDNIYSEWAPNEKVATEVAFGAATGGARAFSGMKHVGLNVAADLVYTASYIGVNGGFVIAVADDPGMHSSQNEQDSRHHAIASKIPMLEPSNSQECKDMTVLAYEISETFDTPVLLRLSTRISHSRSPVEFGGVKDIPLKDYVKNVGKNVMMPAMARARHTLVEERTKKLTEYAENSGINTIELGGDIGIIAAGDTYNYAKEALGDKASYLKLGMVNPLPVELIKEFAKKVKRLIVCEELDDIIETHCRKNGIEVEGKNLFSFCGEYSQSLIKKAVLGTENQYIAFPEELPGRPPVLCAGCPHRGLFYALKGLKTYVSGDIGCYTLGAQKPLSMLDFCVCMGGSVSGLHGFNLARGTEQAKKSVAVIGDSTFIHSGITGLVDIAYNRGISTVIILDNSITGMTGHQNNPANGLTIKGDPTTAVNLEALAHAVGIPSVRVVDPYDVESTRKVIAEELEKEVPSLVIARRPCALLKQVKHKKPVRVNDKCIGCKACLQVGCPAISVENKRSVIDPNQCVGCGVCVVTCRQDAIKEAE